MSLEAEEYTIVKADEVKPVRGLRQFERSATVLAFGGLIYGGFILYNILSGTVDEIRELTGEGGGGHFINPIVFTKEGRVTIYNYLKGRYGLIRAQIFAWDWSAYEKRYDPGSGILKAITPVAAAAVHNWEDILVREGLIVEDAADKKARKLHPVDKVVGRVLSRGGTKMYWGVVLGLMVVPALSVVGGIIRESVKDG